MSSSNKLSLWSDLRSALSGEEVDCTRGDLKKGLFVLAIPMILEMLMQSIFEIVDIFFVGKLGPSPVAAVGLVASMVVLTIGVGLGLSIATTAIVSRLIGENKPEEAAVAGVHAIALTAVVSIPISMLGIFYSKDLLLLMNATPEIIDVGAHYCQVTFGGCFLLLLMFVNNAIFRAAGDSAYSMRSVWIANILNMILDPLFIFGFLWIPEFGVVGAAYATIVGRIIGLTYQIRVLLGGKTRIRIGLEHCRYDGHKLKNLLSKGSTAMLQSLIGTASWMMIMRFVALLGGTILAGFTIAIRIALFALLPAVGVGNATATMVGQNLGAKQPDRAEQAVKLSALSNFTLMLPVTLTLAFFSESLVGAFSADPLVISVGGEILQIISFGVLFWGVGVVLSQAFNGAGDILKPTWLNIICFWAIQLPLAYWLSMKLDLGGAGVCWGIVISDVCFASIGFVWFKGGSWKSVK